VLADSTRDLSVRELAVFDAGDGPELYACGRITQAGGQPMRGVVRWNGVTWRDVGGGMRAYPNCSATTPPVVESLEVFDDGSGPALYAGGLFSCAGGVPARNFARWDGTGWSEVAGGAGNSVLRVYGLAAFEDGRGSGLYAVGAFGTVGPNDSVPSARIARYGCLDTQIPGDLDCDGRVTMFDIDPFVTALADRTGYEAAYPTCRWLNADTNRDAAVDFFDIDPFLACLFDTCP
jgi:hypothetical protein